MIFVYKVWEKFCAGLKSKGVISIPACEIEVSQSSYIILKHDVETNVSRAIKLRK